MGRRVAEPDSAKMPVGGSTRGSGEKSENPPLFTPG